MTGQKRSPRRRLGCDVRRAAILDAALEAFAGAPYAEVSVAAVAQASESSTALVFHYFGSKAQLYEETLRVTNERLATRRAQIEASLPEGASTRDRVRAHLLVHLDHVATHPRAWAAPLLDGEGPKGASELRYTARAEYIEALRGLLGYADCPRTTYALWGYVGFLDQACLAWVEAGCPEDQRGALLDAASGALEGALSN